MNRAHNDSHPRAVLWDLDGTLIDSMEAHWEAWDEIMREEDNPISYETFLEGFGRRNDDVLRDYFGRDLLADELARIAGRKEARYRQHIEEHGVFVLPGAEDWLAELGESGWLCAIGTSAPRQNANIILDISGLALYFDAVITNEDIERGKPDPAVFIAGAAALDVPRTRAIVVEDAAAGVLAAHRGGMRAVGVGPRHDELGADRSAPGLDELPPATFDDLLSAPMDAPKG